MANGMKKPSRVCPWRILRIVSASCLHGNRDPGPTRRNDGSFNAGPVSIPRTPASTPTRQFSKERTNPSSLTRLRFGHNRNPPTPQNGLLPLVPPLCEKSPWTLPIGLGPNSTPPQPLKAFLPFPPPPHGLWPRLPLQVAMPRIISRMLSSGPVNFPVRCGKRPWNRSLENGHAGTPREPPTGSSNNRGKFNGR